MSTFKTAPSPFKADNTASNQCGFTLMNNQIGAVVAQVMATKPNVTVRALPSMIRVDAIGRMDVVYDEISEALGEEPGYYDAAQNIALLNGWLADWVPKAIQAARVLQPLWSQPDSKPPRFEDGLDAVKSRFSDVVTDIGLSVPEELAQ